MNVFSFKKSKCLIKKNSQARVEVNANKELIDKRDEISFKQT